MTTTYIPTSQIANDPAGILWLEKRGGQPGKTTLEDIKDALTEYQTNFKSGKPFLTALRINKLLWASKRWTWLTPSL
jgi:hypothetical protein